MAESLGFHPLQSDDTLLDRLMQESGGEGYDFVFDCAGHQSVADILPDVVKIRGKIEIVAGYKKPPMMNYQKGMFREFSIQFTRVYTFKDFKIAADLASKEPLYEKLINYELPAEERARWDGVAGRMTWERWIKDTLESGKVAREDAETVLGVLTGEKTL